MTEEDKKELFRAEFPESAAAADLFRELFGPGVRLVYAEENGKTISKKYDEAKHEELYRKRRGLI